MMISLSGLMAWLVSYTLGIVADNADMFMAISAAITLDWVSGTVAAIKLGNWQTKKSIKIVANMAVWFILLGSLLTIQKGYGISYLAQSVMFPMIVFSVTSSLKNLQVAGFVNIETLTKMLSKIDTHKDNGKS